MSIQRKIRMPKAMIRAMTTKNKQHVQPIISEPAPLTDNQKRELLSYFHEQPNQLIFPWLESMIQAESNRRQEAIVQENNPEHSEFRDAFPYIFEGLAALTTHPDWRSWIIARKDERETRVAINDIPIQTFWAACLGENKELLPELKNKIWRLFASPRPKKIRMQDGRTIATIPILISFTLSTGQKIGGRNGFFNTIPPEMQERVTHISIDIFKALIMKNLIGEDGVDWAEIPSAFSAKLTASKRERLAELQGDDPVSRIKRNALKIDDASIRELWLYIQLHQNDKAGDPKPTRRRYDAVEIIESCYPRAIDYKKTGKKYLRKNESINFLTRALMHIHYMHKIGLFDPIFYPPVKVAVAKGDVLIDFYTGPEAELPPFDDGMPTDFKVG